jgi:hypothetical protein
MQAVVSVINLLNTRRRRRVGAQASSAGSQREKERRRARSHPGWLLGLVLCTTPLQPPFQGSVRLAAAPSRETACSSSRAAPSAQTRVPARGTPRSLTRVGWRSRSSPAWSARPSVSSENRDRDRRRPRMRAPPDSPTQDANVGRRTPNADSLSQTASTLRSLSNVGGLAALQQVW